MNEVGQGQNFPAKPVPIVAICVPCGDRVHSEFAECLWALGRGAQRHRQGLVFARSSIIVNGRNQCVEAAQHMKADYIFFVDSDMTFPWNTIDRLLAHRKDIVGATYVRRGPPFDTLGKTKSAKGELEGLVEMTHMPTGLLLIKTSVFEKFKQPYFRLDPREDLGLTQGEDMVFSRMARGRDFTLWCDIDLSKECSHMYQYALRTMDPATRGLVEKYEALEEVQLGKRKVVNE